MYITLISLPLTLNLSYLIGENLVRAWFGDTRAYAFCAAPTTPIHVLYTWLDSFFKMNQLTSIVTIKGNRLKFLFRKCLWLTTLESTGTLLIIYNARIHAQHYLIRLCLHRAKLHLKKWVWVSNSLCTATCTLKLFSGFQQNWYLYIYRKA